MFRILLPHPTYDECARTFDNEILDTQITEVSRLLTLLEDVQIVAQILQLPDTDLLTVREYLATIAECYWLRKERIVWTPDGNLWWVPREDLHTIPSRQVLTLQGIRHPMCRIWFRYSGSLRLYLHCLLREWRKRGYWSPIPSPIFEPKETIVHPPWMGNIFFHFIHRGLLRDRKWEVYEDSYGDWES